MVKAAAHHLMAQEQTIESPGFKARDPRENLGRSRIRLRIPRRMLSRIAPRIARVLDRIIFGGLIMMPVLFAIPYGSVEPWWEATFECSAFTLTGLWVIEGWISGSWCGAGRWWWRWSGSNLMIPLLAIVLFAFAQSWAGPAFSADPYATQLFSYKLLALILAGALLLSHTSTPHRLRLLIVAIIGIALVSAIFGILRQTIQRDDGFVLFYLRPGEGFAQFINRNHFAFLMEMALGLVSGLMVGGGMHHERLLVYFAAAAPLWSALVLSNSRGGICSLISQALFLALVSGIRRATMGGSRHSRTLLDWLGRSFRSLLAQAALIIGLLTAIGVGVLWLGGDPLAGRLETLPGEIKTSGAGERRLEVWGATWQLIKDYPIVGVGFNAYGMAINQYHRASGELIPREAHNDYLELLASGGLIGTGLALWFVVALVRMARSKLRTGDPLNRSACLGALIGLVGVAVHSLVDFGLHITINALICTSLVAIIALREEGFDKERKL